MNIISRKGLIIKEVKTGEGNKIFTILTPQGLVSASAPGVRSLKSKLSSGCSLFGFSDFELKKSRDIYTILSAENIESFYEIRTDVIKLALAVYLGDIVRDTAVTEQDSPGILRLMLNTLFYLTEHEEINKIKAVFELRVMAECGLFIPEEYLEGLSKPAYDAVKYITTCPSQKIFSFTAGENIISEIGRLSEKYIIMQTGKKHRSLEYLLSL